MKTGRIIVLLSLSLISCKETNKQIVKAEQVQYQEQKKLHWRNLAQYVDPKDETYKEVMKGREEKYQQVMRKISVAGLNAPPAYGFAESDYSLNDINLMNELYYDGLKSRGFQFPSEEVFNMCIKEFYGVDLTQDQSNNPRVRQVGDFLILVPKLYTEEIYKEVPMLVFSYPCIVFDVKRRYYIDNLKISSEELDDYDETYYRFGMSSLDLAYNNYIFYESKAAFAELNPYAVTDFTVIAGNDNLPIDLLKDYQKKVLKEYEKSSEHTRIGWDYRMFDRLFFSRSFDGKLIVKKKMLAAAIELAQENEDYISVPLDYYFIQMTTKYIPNEYAADNGEVENYRTILEPYYTPEERAMIWVYTSLLELNVSPKVSSSIPYTFISLAHQFPELYDVAEAHHFFGEDMTAVLEYLE
ncbi:hypothetical protein [Myroides odoratus]|uniref:Uncharacterized protein n=1 Tax=Myroides odoratus TaxID=256 RepID=A0A9Q7EAL4_MYROD|nr:hypothetical protein [Myroides odoratus]EHQ42000.1 hypothetical protein Myrod_1167 [Myroides odoratus DSM 2801]EKB03050.1 hypothetical protein HMPREF9716_03588 [Myroides odoratus CIP 103059]QQT99389.1 hypothetical protein I6I88_14515 [Myroides odoratus]WQD58409.1 hypothetical protein U0010_04445 [Myroides odoratus]STZ29263.1 Uncharacterised protein [Myroides odoratus]